MNITTLGIKKTRPCESRLECFHNGIILIVNCFHIVSKDMIIN